MNIIKCILQVEAISIGLILVFLIVTLVFKIKEFMK